LIEETLDNVNRFLEESESPSNIRVESPVVKGEMFSSERDRLVRERNCRIDICCISLSLLKACLASGAATAAASGLAAILAAFASVVLVLEK